jgi:hypothetical protein
VTRQESRGRRRKLKAFGRTYFTTQGISAHGSGTVVFRASRRIERYASRARATPGRSFLRRVRIVLVAGNAPLESGFRRRNLQHLLNAQGTKTQAGERQISAADFCFAAAVFRGGNPPRKTADECAITQ